MTYRTWTYFVAGFATMGASSAHAAAPARDPAFIDMLREMVEIDSSHQSGSCTTVAEKIAQRLKAGGIPEKDVHVFIPEGHPKDGNVVAVLRGSDPSAKAVLMSGHIDVVNANREDWTRDPYKMIEEGGYFYGRGVADMKAQDAIWIDNMLRYVKEGYKPRRTIKLALTCGEEGKFVNGIGWLLENQRELIDAGISFNEGGYGDLEEKTGKKLALTVLAAEKNSETLVLETTNPGGHSSRPRPDNAIYALSEGLVRLSKFKFPVHWNPINRAYFTRMAPVVGGDMGAAMKRLLADPNDAQADAIVSSSSMYNAMLRTVCSATLLQAGHAGNALPQRARATVNCRLLPGISKASVREAIVKAIGDPQVAVIGTTSPDPSYAPTAVPEPVLGLMEKVATKIYPGIPVVPMQATGGTDGKRLTANGIPTYGITGMFREADFSNAHGLNERMLVYTVWEGREYLYQLIKAFSDARSLDGD